MTKIWKRYKIPQFGRSYHYADHLHVQYLYADEVKYWALCSDLPFNLFQYIFILKFFLLLLTLLQNIAKVVTDEPS